MCPAWKTSRVLTDLTGGHADRTWEKRVRELVRFDVLILDDFAMRGVRRCQLTSRVHQCSPRFTPYW